MTVFLSRIVMPSTLSTVQALESILGVCINLHFTLLDKFEICDSKKQLFYSIFLRS
jgi:hypothetical protein